MAEPWEAARPRRDDPKYNGDQEAYRKAYKCWHTWQSRMRKQADGTVSADPAEPPFKKPTGRVPKVDGVACEWDGEQGCWREASGAVHDSKAKREADKRSFFDTKKTEQASMTEQRRKLIIWYCVCSRVERHKQGTQW